MPVRIYDISKKLGLENKEVLAKAKELGIAAARVASSSLDKITAEYLVDQLKLAHPELTAPPPSAAPAVPPIESAPPVVVEVPPPAALFRQCRSPGCDSKPGRRSSYTGSCGTCCRDCGSGAPLRKCRPLR